MAIRKVQSKFMGYVNLQFLVTTRTVFNSNAPQSFTAENSIFNTGAVFDGPVLSYQSFAYNQRNPAQVSLFTDAGNPVDPQNFDGAYIHGKTIAMRRRPGFLATEIEVYSVEQPFNVVGNIVSPPPALTLNNIPYTPPPGVQNWAAYTPLAFDGLAIAKPFLDGLNVNIVGVSPDLNATRNFGAFQLEPDENANNVLRACSLTRNGRNCIGYSVADAVAPDIDALRVKRFTLQDEGTFDFETVELVLEKHGRSQMSMLVFNNSFGRVSDFGFSIATQNFDLKDPPADLNAPYYKARATYFEFSPSGDQYRIYYLCGDADFEAQDTYIPYFGQAYARVFTNGADGYFTYLAPIGKDVPQYEPVALPCYSPCIPVIDKRPGAQ